MSMILGTPPPQHVVSVEQLPNGSSRLVLSIPMLFDKSNGTDYPAPQNFSLPGGFGFAGARGRQDASGSWNWEITCEGGPSISPGGSPGAGGGVEEMAEYAFEPSDLELPITSHPDILKLIDTYGGRVEDGRVIFRDKVPKTKEGDQAAAKDLVTKKGASPMFGVEAYTSFAGTWTKSYTLTKGDGLKDIFADVEKIVENPPMPGWITFTFGNNRNWLKRMPSIRVKGNSLQITERYLLSGLGGHNPAVYTGRQSF